MANETLKNRTFVLYPNTIKQLEKLKKKQKMTWDELFTYLMEVKTDETTNETKPNQKQ